MVTLMADSDGIIEGNAEVDLDGIFDGIDDGYNEGN